MVSGNKEKPEFLRWWLLSLFFIGLAWFWAGVGAHSLWDRDEPRYSEATRHMVESGDWIVPRFNGAIRYDKPILVYWLMGISVKIFGLGEFAVRAPAGVAGTVTALLIFLLAHRFGAGFQARMLAAVCGLIYALLMVVSKAATTDAVLTLTVVACLFLHWEQLRLGFSWGRHLGFSAIMALSLIHKGPVGPPIVLLAMAANALWSWRVDPAGRRSRPGSPHALVQIAVAIVVILAVALPWAVAVQEATDGDFLLHSFKRHVVERATSAMESHGGPIFYYIPVLLIGTFPFAALTLVTLPWAWRERADARVRFLWSWLLPGLLMFSIVRTKLPHYIAPLLPAVALMTALWWEQRPAPGGWWWRAGALVMGLLGAGLLVGLPIGVFLMRLPILPPAVSIAVCAGIGSIAGAVLWWRLDAPRAVSTWAITWALAAGLTYLWALPALEPMQASKRLMAFVRAVAPPGTRICAVEFNEPTLVFYGGTQITMFSSKSREIPKGLAILWDGKPAVFVMPESRWEKWNREATEPIPESARIIHRGAYLAANRGKVEKFVVIGNFPVVSK